MATSSQSSEVRMRTCEAKRSGSARYEATSQRGRLSCSSRAANGRCQSTGRSVGGVEQRLGSLVEHREDALAGERLRQQGHEALGEPAEIDEAARGAAVGSAHPEQQLRSSCTTRGRNPPAASAWISLKVRCRVTKIEGSRLPWPAFRRPVRGVSAAAVDCG